MVLADVRHPGLRTRAVDLERADYEDVVPFSVAKVRARLDAEAGRVDEVGVVLAGRDQDDWRRSGPSRLRSPRSRWLAGLGIEPEARLLDGLRYGLQQRIVAAASGPSAAAAFEVELFLDLVSARVRDLIAEVAELGEVAAEGALRDPGAVGQLERIETG